MTNKQTMLLAEITNRQKAIQIERAKLEEEERVLDEKYKNISRASIYVCDDIVPVLEYFVGLMEGKQYFYKERKIPTTDLTNIRDKSLANDISCYRIGFLCSDPDAAIEDINIRIEDLYNASNKELMLNEILLQPALNYIQIIFYKAVSGIKFVNNFNTDKNAKEYPNDETNIVDERYLYIIDFINFLTDKRLEKNGEKLTQKEMMDLAFVYVQMLKSDELKR